MLSVLDPIHETLPTGGNASPTNGGGRVQNWGREEVAAWLTEVGMGQYQVSIIGEA